MVVLAEEKSTPVRRLGDVREVCKRLSRSRSTVLKLDDAGAIPKSVRVGHGRLWDLSRLEKWIEDGCPRLGEEKAETVQ